MANASGCDTSSTKQIVDCVMRLSEEDLLSISKRVYPGETTVNLLKLLIVKLLFVCVNIIFFVRLIYYLK